MIFKKIYIFLLCVSQANTSTIYEGQPLIGTLGVYVFQNWQFFTWKKIKTKLICGTFSIQNTICNGVVGRRIDNLLKKIRAQLLKYSFFFVNLQFLLFLRNYYRMWIFQKNVTCYVYLNVKIKVNKYQQKPEPKTACFYINYYYIADY